VKNQYFGDVNDYRKYGLLRALCGDADLSLSVAWMLTPDDGSTDGGLRTYLRCPNQWRRHDPALYDWLASAMGDGAARSVDLLEKSALFPRARYNSEIVPDDRLARGVWASHLVSSAEGTDLVFLDPDNGLEIPSKPVGSKDSSKYAFWSEVEALWSAGSSLLIYQHFRRENRAEFAQRMMKQLSDRTGAPLVEAFRTPHVLFLLAGQERHREVLEEGIATRLAAWRGQIGPVRTAVAHGTQNREVVEIDRRELLAFFDQAPDSTRGHATSIVAVAGEELGLALLVDYFNRTRVAARILPGSCTQGAPRGHRLDGWVEAGDTLYQVEVKNWSAHSIGGTALPATLSEGEMAAFRRKRWNEVWRNGNLVDAPAQKVLERMRPPVEHSNVRPLIVFWVPMHPEGRADALFTVSTTSAHFPELTVFSMSNYLRGLSEDRVSLNLPHTAARLAWLARLFKA